MGPYRVLPLRVKVDLGVMAMKEYSTLPKAWELDLHHQMVLYSYPEHWSVEVQLACSTAPAGWAIVVEQWRVRKKDKNSGLRGTKYNHESTI